MTDLSEIERHAIKLVHHRAHAIPNPVLPEEERLDDLNLAYSIQDAGATAWLANTLATKGRTLKARDYVTTGSVTPPIPVEPRQQVLADFGPFGAG